MYKQQILTIVHNLNGYMRRLDRFQSDQRFLFNAYTGKNDCFCKQKIASLPYLTTPSNIRLQSYKRLNQIKGYCYNYMKKSVGECSYFIILNSDIEQGELELKRLSTEKEPKVKQNAACFHLNLFKDDKLNIDNKTLACLSHLCQTNEIHDLVIMGKTVYQAAILTLAMHLSTHLNTLFSQPYNNSPCHQDIEKVMSVIAVSLARDQTFSVNITEFYQIKMAYRLALLLSVMRFKEDLQTKIKTGAHYQWNPFSMGSQKTLDLLNHYLTTLREE